MLKLNWSMYEMMIKIEKFVCCVYGYVGFWLSFIDEKLGSLLFFCVENVKNVFY